MDRFVQIANWIDLMRCYILQNNPKKGGKGVCSGLPVDVFNNYSLDFIPKFLIFLILFIYYWEMEWQILMGF